MNRYSIVIVVYLCIPSGLDAKKITAPPQQTEPPCTPLKELLTADKMMQKKSSLPVPHKKEATVQTTDGTHPVITVSNDITQEMTAYKHFTKHYTPDSFSVSVNGIPLSYNESKQIPLQGKTLKITYEYSFLYGYRTGKKEEIIELADNAKPVSLRFSWIESPAHMIINQPSLTESPPKDIKNEK